MTDQYGRILINFQPLPKREKALDRETIDADIREAIAKAEDNLKKRAAVHTLNGWVPDPDYGQNGYDFGVMSHTIIGRLRLIRA